ncbi:MAG: hypothetical protein RL701_1438 [Pseudomonadota bacterium]
MTLVLRAATAGDLAQIATLHRESILQLCHEHYSAEQLTDWTAALRPEAYAALLASHRMFVAIASDSELLGFGVLDPGQGLVNATYVHPSAVRRGVGKQLLEAMEACAKDAGRSQLQLNATLNAITFYERCGYVSQGRTSNRLPTGVDLPCEAMQKTLVTAH